MSALNECRYCFSSHAAYAAAQLPPRGDVALVEQVRADLGAAPVSEKLRALLAIAAAVPAERAEGLRAERSPPHAKTGATDLEIHDTVLIAAAFCMYNRYVDGLATWAPERREDYREPGRMLAEEGYVRAGERIAAMAATPAA